jgi:hypothetical protein
MPPQALAPMHFTALVKRPHWQRLRGDRIFGPHPVHPCRFEIMFTLFWHAGVFLFLTFVVYHVCMWMVRVEDRRAKRRG